MNTQAREAGLTLLEVMVALFILVSVLVTGFMVYLSALTGNAAASDRTRAAQVTTHLSSRVTQREFTLAANATRYFAFSGTPVQERTLTTAPASCATYLRTNQDHYCATVQSTANFSPVQDGIALLGTGARVYTIRSCWQEREEVRCVQANTVY